jgi:iron complex outermembrane receptor protein
VEAELRVRAAAGRSFRAPTFTERYYRDPVNVGRPDLDPERAWSVEVGADWTPGTGARLSLTGFLRRSTDLIDWARAASGPDDAPWETRNVEEANFRGLEGDVEVMGPFGVRWIAGGTLLSVDSEEVAGFSSKYALRPLTQRITLGVQRTLADRAVLRISGVQGKRAGDDPYHRIDFRASVRMGPGWAYLDARNLTDAEYPDVTRALAPGRAFFVGFEVGR